MAVPIYLRREAKRIDSGARPGRGRLEIRDNIRAALGADGPQPRVLWIEEADEVGARASEADCLVIVLPSVSDSERRFLGGLPEGMPKVLVTEEPREAAFKLRRLVIEEIVGVEALQVELAGAVRRARASGLLGWAGALITNLEGLSSTLRAWLLTVLTTFPPPRTVEAAAQAIGRSGSAIRRHWEREIGRSSPGVFLHWVILVRAMAQKRPAVSWPEVARELERSHRTLKRAAQKLAGTDLDCLSDGSGAKTLRRDFEAYLVRTLVEPR